MLTVVLLPTGALQLAVSREISRHEALGEPGTADAFGRAMLRFGLLVTAPLVVVASALVVPLRSVLEIDSTAAVALVMASLAAALVTPIALGALLGYQRFYAVAALSVFPFALRLAIVAATAVGGYRLGGVATATFVSAIATALVAIWLIRARLAGAAQSVRPALGPFLRYLWPVFVGLLGIALLTTIDLLVVRARFDPTDSGAYAAASAFARIAFFLPATILAVVFPRTAARQARGEATEDILGRSLIATASFGALLALFYGMTGRGLLDTSFGTEFVSGGGLLVLFTISMTLFSLANVLVGFHLSRNETRFAWIVAAAVPVQVAVLALVPNSLEGVILADIAVGTALLAAHEVLVDTSIPALDAGMRRLWAESARWRPRARRVVREGVFVLLAGTVVVLILFWPLVTAFGSMVVGEGSDTNGAMASFWWMQHEGGYHLFGATHHTLTGAPFGWDEGSGNHIQSLLPYYPAYLLTKIIGPVAAYNAVLLAGYVLSGASMYVLARYLGCARMVAAWAGMVYIVFPWHLQRTQAASLIHLEFLPLVILGLVAASRRPSWSQFSLVGLATLGCWLTAGYLGAMAFFATAAYGLTLPLTMGLRRGVRTFAGLLASATAATAAVAVLSMISGFGRGAGLHRVAGDLAAYGLHAVELVIPAAGNLVLGDGVRASLLSLVHDSNPTETSYVGALTIALVLIWIVATWQGSSIRTRGHRPVTAGLLAVLFTAFLMGLPSPMSFFGHSVVMPSRLLWEFIPAIRIPARWVILMMTALVPLGALGLQLIYSRVEGRGRRWRGLEVWPAAVVAAVMLISFFELAVSPARTNFRTKPLPPEYTALAQTPEGIVAEYPLVTSNDRIIWQTVYRRPLLNNADFGIPADDARRMVLDPAAPGAASVLAFLGVTAIVTHPNALDYGTDVPDVPNASWGPGYALVSRSPDGSSTWRVTAPPAPALVTLPSGFGEPLSARDDHVVRFPLTSPSGVGYLEFRAKEPRVIRLTFDAEPAAGKTRVLRVADPDSEVPFRLKNRTRVSVLTEVPQGLSRLLLKTDPAATSTEDAIVISGVRALPAAGTPTLQAESVSPDLGFEPADG